MTGSVFCGKCRRVRAIGESVAWVRRHGPGAHHVEAKLTCGHVERFIGPAADWPLAQPLPIERGTGPKVMGSR